VNDVDDETESPDLARARDAAYAARIGPEARHTAEVVGESHRLVNQMRSVPMDEFVEKIRMTFTTQRGEAA
jgi:hypothetical protein